MKSTTRQPAILGGKPIRTAPFPRRRTIGQAEKAAVLEVLDSDVLSGFIAGPGKFFLGGERVRRFEQAWAGRHGFKHAISVNTWTSGLVIAMGAVGVEPGDEVICTPFSMSASATCALFYGGIPVFADIDPDTFGLDPRSVERCITERTKAIVVVHLFGYPADMDGIMSLASSRGIRVVEDAAQAPGITYRGRPVGSIGDLGGFSLNYHKHVHTGEGGMLVTDDDDLAFRCSLIRNHGENVLEDYQVENIANAIGGNSRMTELQAAIGIEQLRRLRGSLECRRELGAHLGGRLGRHDGLTVQELEDGSTHAYYMFPVRYDADSCGLTRHQLVRAVNAEFPEPSGYETTPLVEGYVKPLYLNPVYEKRIAIGTKGFPFHCNPGVDYVYRKGLCPVAERMYERELVLSPLVREPLTTRDMDDLADAVEKVLEHADALRARFLDEGDEQDAIYTSLDAVNRTR